MVIGWLRSFCLNSAGFAVQPDADLRRTIRGVPRSVGTLRSFFLLRAHLLTTSSSQAPYPSPRRMRQGLLIPLLLLSPQSRLFGDPCRRWYGLRPPCAFFAMTQRIDKAQHTAYNTANPARGHRVRPGERRAVHTKAVSHSLIKGVMRMRKERWRKLLRFLICLILVFLILMYISPNVR